MWLEKKLSLIRYDKLGDYKSSASKFIPHISQARGPFTKRYKIGVHSSIGPVRQTYRQTEDREMRKQNKTINKEISLHSSRMAKVQSGLWSCWQA